MGNMATVDSLDIQISASAQSASKSIDNLVGKLNTLSKALKIDTSGLEKIGKLNLGSGLQNVGNQAKKVSENFSEIANQSKEMAKTVSSSMSSAAKPMEEVRKSVSEISADFQEKFKGIDVKIDFSKPESELKKFQNQAKNAQNALTRILASSTADKQTKGIEKWTIALAQANNAIEQLQSKMKEPVTFQGDLSAMSEAELDEWFKTLPSQQQKIEEVSNAIAEASQRVSEYTGKWNGIEIPEFLKEIDTSGIDQIAQKSQTASGKFEELFLRLNQLEVPEIREENLDKLYNSLDKAESKLEELRTNLANGLTMGRITESVDDSGFVKLQEQIALTEKTAEALRQKISEIESQAEAGGFERPKSAFSSIASFAQKASSAFSGFFSGLNKFGNSTKNAASKLTSLAGIGKKLNTTFSGGLKTILKYALGIRSLYVLFNKLRSSIKEGMNNLVQYSSETNASVSLLYNSMNQLKNASAAMVAPLLNAIAPALNTIIQLFIKAENAVNQFLAALTRQSTWIRATQLTEDYADSISSAAKEAKNGIRSFDELKVITT